jgi:hypothetical protein
MTILAKVNSNKDINPIHQLARNPLHTTIEAVRTRRLIPIAYTFGPRVELRYRAGSLRTTTLLSSCTGGRICRARELMPMKAK